MTKQEKKHPQFLYLRSIPENVKHQFKAMCAEKGVTMTSEICLLMKKEVQAHRARKHWLKEQHKNLY